MEAEPDLVEKLGHLQFTATLPESVREALAGIATERTASQGELLCREGESIDELALIQRGHVGLDMFVPGRGQVRVLTLGPGEILAWSAIVGSHGATATGIAVEETKAIVFHQKDFIRLCESNHEVGYLLMRELSKAISKRLVATRLQLLDLFEEEAPSS